jgi:thiamine-phosphate diphosphorylase
VTLCLVTDRKRLGGAAPLLEQLKHAVDVGVDLIQIRERDLEAAALADLVARAVAIARGSSTRVVVNDRLDVAIACGADGVHLRGDSIPIAAARRLAPQPFLVGKSVHSEEEAREAIGADYLIAGTVYPTASKPNARVTLGAAGLRAIVGRAAAPVLAIGGVTRDRLGDVAASGASGVAAIGLFLDEQLAEIVCEARRRFDTARSAP